MEKAIIKIIEKIGKGIDEQDAEDLIKSIKPHSNQKPEFQHNLMEKLDRIEELLEDIRDNTRTY